MNNNRMRVGLLWFDDDPKKEVSLKAKEAAERYLEKFGRWPNVCYVSPVTLPLPRDAERIGIEGVHLDGLCVLSSPLILLDHFWVGESRQSKEAEKRAPQSQG
ncbi:MAG: hypothetical protein ACE5II_06110 [Anaerolineae bacterium]